MGIPPVGLSGQSTVKISFSVLDSPLRGWPSTFVNKAGVLLTLYVDDFLFAGKSEDVRLAAKAVSSVLNMGKTEAVDKFLGCFYPSSTVDGISKISIN